jgi:hypothetical protein
MKALLKKLLPLTLFAIAVTSLFSVQPAQGFTVTLKQVGSSVVATGNGPINLTGLTFSNTSPVFPGIVANLGDVLMTSGNSDLYRGFTGPTNFGSGGPFSPNTFSGDSVGISPDLGLLGVPLGYVSGAPLSASMTFDNATLAGLGVTPGTYVWSWGTGLPNQNFTLIIARGVPDGGSTVSLLSFALLGLSALRRKLSC